MKNNEGVACSVSVLIVLLLLLLLLFCSCTKRVYETQYVEQPVYLHDTLRSTIYSHDTTIVIDSVFFAIKGDTIVRERYNTIERIKVAHDTIMRFVEKPVEVVREHPFQCSRKQRMANSSWNLCDGRSQCFGCK